MRAPTRRGAGSRSRRRAAAAGGGRGGGVAWAWDSCEALIASEMVPIWFTWRGAESGAQRGGGWSGSTSSH